MSKALSWQRRASTRISRGLSRRGMPRRLVLSASLFAAIILAPAIVETGVQAQDGRIFRFISPDCNDASCPGWQMLDNNPASVRIAAVGDGSNTESRVYQLHNDGRIFRFTGQPCNGEFCPGWQMLDNNPATIGIAAYSVVNGADQVFQLHKSGHVFRFTGTPCDGESCHGWETLDNNPGTLALATGEGALYKLHKDGRIFQFTGPACNSVSCPGWQMLDNNPATVRIAAGSNRSLYQLHDDGRIFKYLGTPCDGQSCLGWQMLDNNPATIAIVGGNIHSKKRGAALYQMRDNGHIFRFTRTSCNDNGCPGWVMIDNNSNSGRLSYGSVSNSGLYKIHADRLRMTRERTCAE